MPKGVYKRTRSLAKDLSGLKFNRWHVLHKVRSQVGPSGQKKTQWHCRCECGTERNVSANSLTSGKSKSCGCYLLDKIRREPGAAAATNIFSNYRCKARRKNILFEISEQDFLSIASKNCFYCGASPKNLAKNHRMNGSFRYSGIDRLDNTKGYTPQNCVPSCKDCNLAKRRLHASEFLHLIARIYNKHRGVFE